ncbi:hypothetical protein GCM10011371_06910 [Novosphingobium marinum]|uniref:Quinol monooxygenase YgiN n=1 Tax=Novosphingobium marinum TaxID=1514948 RepID=A0A7Y9XWI1_9SPHN|nr:antibiotic biosynthesis monooxygenase [Novosphingobium marinum]NYH94378.1 quinol monooxygenase YgiN [Novosphingobium marinum]GGC21894.1 hypothetical protein GCM10011371_06910 [Novosphingobium marinum]
MQITAIVRLEVKPESMDAISATMREAIDVASAKPDCAMIDVTLAANDDPVMYLYEKWSSQDALDAHVASDFMQDLLGKLPGWLTAPPQVTIARTLQNEPVEG